jgi:hypothetical protein
MTRGVSISIFFALLAPSLAYADVKTECVAASEKAQQLRDDRKLIEARAEFLACARDVCPSAVKKDCADQIADVDKRTPSIVVHAKDKNGQDLVAVHVTSDGALLTDQLDGRSIPLNPGVHTFRFEAGSDSQEQKIVLSEGEHDRAIAVQLGQPVVVVATNEHVAKKGVPVAAFIVGGVGLVSMAVAPIFYAMGLSQKSTDETAPSGCKFNPGGCTNDEINSIQTKLVIGDVFMIGGAVILAGGIIWTIVHYATGNKESPTAAAFVPSIAPTTFGRGAVASATIRW